MEGANRLTKFVLESGAIDEDDWIREFMEGSQKGLSLIGSDREAFEEFLKMTTLKLAKEMKRREGN